MSRWRDPKFRTEYWRNYQRKRRAENVARGLCYCGRERFGDLSHCRHCLQTENLRKQRRKHPWSEGKDLL